MAILAHHADLHEIGIQRRQRAIERAGKLRNGVARRRRHFLALGGIGQPGAHPHRQPPCVSDLLSAMRSIERSVDLGKVPHMRAVQDSSTELDRLDRILTTMARERATDEDDRREAIDQAKLTQRIHDVDVGLAVR